MEKKIKLFDRKVEIFAGREESLKMLIVVGLVSIVAPISIILFASNSDLFYRKAIPKKYWAKEVKNLEAEIQRGERLLQYYRILIEKKPEEAVSAAENLRAMFSGEEPQKIESLVKGITEGERIEVEELKLKIEFTKKDLESKRRLFEQAKGELAKFK